MFRYYASFSLKQLAHLRLRKPDGLILKTNVQFYRLVRLVNDYLVFHADFICGNFKISHIIEQDACENKLYDFFYWF